MTRKDYKVIARALNKYKNDFNIANNQYIALAQCISDVLEKDNPKFNPNYFLQECWATRGIE